MSIWCSSLVLEDDEPDQAPLVYQQSHVLPSADGPRGGEFHLAHIPGFITRDGRDDAAEGGSCWPYLRVSLRSPIPGRPDRRAGGVAGPCRREPPMNDNPIDPADSTAELVMPFLPVASKGGPFDDHAYAAGYEMGLLDALLGHSYTFGRVHRVIREENRAQADLLAMRHGWRTTFFEYGVEWVGVEFVRIDRSRG